ncbi:MAG: hypothetical protein ABIR18_12655 [Chitinophagaceae bacterium]
MKKICFVFVTFLFAIALLAPGCKKSNDAPAPGPDVLKLSEGFLTTKTGYNSGHLGDTAIIRVYGGGGPSGSYQVAGTIKGASVESIDHYWKIENAGGSSVYIRSKKNGYYLGCRKAAASSGYYAWGKNWAAIDKDPTDRNKLSVVKNGDKFYIQPADDNTLYLNTTVTSQISYTGPKDPQELHFLETKQEFFFLKPF